MEHRNSNQSNRSVDQPEPRDPQQQCVSRVDLQRRRGVNGRRIGSRLRWISLHGGVQQRGYGDPRDQRRSIAASAGLWPPGLQDLRSK